MEWLWNFIKEYYIDSIVYKEGYNPVNTLTWAVILIIAVFAIYKFLEKRLEIDTRFVYANIPYIFLGSSVRVVEDAGFLKPPLSYVFMTPLIYILIFAIAFPALLISVKRFGREYYRPYSAVGIVLSLGVIVLLFTNLSVENGWIIPAGLALSLLGTFIFYLISPGPMKNQLSLLTIFSHMFDGFETYFGIAYLGYWELHVLPRILISTFGPAILPVVKFGVFFAILYLLDTSDEEEKLKNYIKFVLIVLGLAPGLRDGIRMMFGT
ncbi:DUF63 family protein [Archaeoglobus neptunius]|uniref:DUF63 family protein n=1 Tax=Archaeoglobus neptunius TaxID=2798580 RepID=UPI001E5B51CF|nr:DUF63 family protein [Archaeoglobus neptunius]